MSPSGALTPLYDFSGADGVGPQAGLVLSTDGNLYGATYTSYTPNNSNNPGTAFKLSPAGALTTLYTFCSQNGCVDGRFPAGLVRGTDGNFYGTTYDGGASDCFGFGCGTVFKITASGVLTVLHSFLDSPTDGSHPIAGLIQGANGKCGEIAGELEVDTIMEGGGAASWRIATKPYIDHCRDSLFCWVIDCANVTFELGRSWLSDTAEPQCE